MTKIRKYDARVSEFQNSSKLSHKLLDLNKNYASLNLNNPALKLI